MKYTCALLLGLTLTCACLTVNAAASSDTNYTKEMRRIFDDFIRYEDHVDSHANKEILKKCFLHFQGTAKDIPWQLLLNIRMYYDATDFDGLPMLDIIFENNKAQAIKAIEYRQKHKKNWESDNNSPFSELEQLKKRLTEEVAEKSA